MTRRALLAMLAPHRAGLSADEYNEVRQFVIGLETAVEGGRRPTVLNHAASARHMGRLLRRVIGWT